MKNLALSSNAVGTFMVTRFVPSYALLVLTRVISASQILWPLLESALPLSPTSGRGRNSYGIVISDVPSSSFFFTRKMA